jgi:hypothetical protein
MPEVVTNDVREALACRGFHWVTGALMRGGYPLLADCELLRQDGVTHLFNLDLPYPDADAIAALGFKELVWQPIVDGRRIPDRVLLQSLDRLHRIIATDQGKVLVHCHAGMNRAPTIVWLYLIACGTDPEEAARMIADGSPSAVPGHPALCDEDSVRLAQAHGRAHYQPPRRSGTLKAV